MKSIKNSLLGIIAFFLVLLTLIQLEVWPTKAIANNSTTNISKFSLFEYDGELLLLNTENGRVEKRAGRMSIEWKPYMITSQN